MFAMDRRRLHRLRPPRRRAGHRGVPRRRHRDQRPWPATAARSPRSARCSSAAASCTTAGRRSSPVRAPLSRGHPALHGRDPGDGRRGAAGRDDAARARRAARGPRAGGPQRRRSIGVCSPRPLGARASRGRTRRRCARSRWRGGCTRSRASASSGRWPSRWASTSRCPTARSPTPRPAHASSARSFRGCAPTRGRWARRSRCWRPRGARVARRSDRRRAVDARRAAPEDRLLGVAARARRLHLPQRRGPAALRRQVGGHPGTRARRTSGPRHRTPAGSPRSRRSTGSRPTASSARC